MLTSKQRATLRGIASTYETIFQVGKGGISDTLVQQVSDALRKRELIKMHVLDNCPLDAREAAQELAERLAEADEEEIATILGPTALPKFRGEYRCQIIVKAAEEEPLRQLVLPTVERMKKERSRNVRVGLALNPTNIV